MAWSLAVAALYTASTLALGRRLAPPMAPGWEGLAGAVHYALGAAAFGLLFALLAMLRVAYVPVVIALALLPLALRPFPKRLEWKTCIDRPPAQVVAAAILVVLIALLAAYPLATALAPVRGGDMAIYHLVVPRTVLWNHGLVFNPFSHDAGLYYGWQLYALPAYFMDGDRAFQLCSVAALAILASTACRVLAPRRGVLAGLLGALVVVAVACGMSRESVTNNDVPLALLECALLGLAATAAPRRAAAWVLGLLGGFAIAVKLVALPSAGVAYGAFLWRTEPARRTGLAAALAIATVLSAGPWPVFNHLSSGSPLPHFLMVWPPDTGYLSQYREGIDELMRHFGEWYRKNFFRLFSHGLGFVPLLMAGYAFMPFVRAARTDPLCLTLAAWALAKALLLLALNGFDAALLFHDRYHLPSYLLLALGGLACWLHALRRALAARPLLATVGLPALALAGTLDLYRAPVPSVQVNGGGQPDTVVALPSLERGMRSAIERISEPPGGDTGYDFAATKLPPNAVIATTVIDPYLLQRPFLQVLPVSENVIDLSLPPEALRRALLAHGATHLHLTQHTGLNPWMAPLTERWLGNLRKIPELPGVRRLDFSSQPTQKGMQAFYEL